jgi:3',5'-cyclic AMP phosphodiesterase CpdA
MTWRRDKVARAWVTLAIGITGALATTGTAWAAHLDTDVEGHTTLDQVLAPVRAPGAGYAGLRPEVAGAGYVVRDGTTEVAEEGVTIPNALPGRETRRLSLAYFGHMTDLHVADEESPARTEFLDRQASSAWRPWEALTPFIVDRAVRQLNRFAGASPVTQGHGTANAMDFTLLTGDLIDSQQRNEAAWARDLLEGNGRLRFNSGLSDPRGYDPTRLPARCRAFANQAGGPAPAAAEGAAYTGVQDDGDYPPGARAEPAYYDPDDVRGGFAEAGWPTYRGLMDAAQATEIVPPGLDVPFYLANGSHDVLAQGSSDATAALEQIATGCAKVLRTRADPGSAELDDLASPGGARALMLVPPDEGRQFVSKPQLKAIQAANDPVEKHGFGFVDGDEEENSDGAASYYAWDPPQAPGTRFISMDTTAEGGGIGPAGSARGNIDDLQFEWLKEELDAAQLAGKLIVVFGHHPVRAMDSLVGDEAASPCTIGDGHGHDVNPGCDLDPRSSEPVHLGDSEVALALGNEEKTFADLLGKYPNVLAYVAGHAHENEVLPFAKQGAGVWWEITTSALADYPQQQRLIEVMDNRDGTLSIFGTLLDHASPATAPPAGAASRFDAAELASIARTLAFNDPQTGAAANAEAPEDAARDGNVELLLRDPRSLQCEGETADVVGSGGFDTIEGTKGRDVIVGLGGRDKVKTGNGKDLVCGGDGADKLKGGSGKDRFIGGSSGDKLKGAKGADVLKGGGGRDRLKGGAGGDLLTAGKGGDSCKGGSGTDRMRGC